MSTRIVEWNVSAVVLVGTVRLSLADMLPRLQIAIRRHDFSNFRTLEDIATRVERSYQADKTYRPPLSPEQLLFPDLAYRVPKNKIKAPHTVATVSSPAEKKAGKKKHSESVPAANVAAATSASVPTNTPSDPSE